MLNLDYMLDQLIIGSLLKRAFVLVPLHILPSSVLYVQARIDLGSKQRAWLSPSLTAAARRRRRRPNTSNGGRRRGLSKGRSESVVVVVEAAVLLFACVPSFLTL